ncbi:MAG: RNA polymerase-associated protein [Cryomorphaceae bacterium]|jgi:RNA polymerase-associated protein
MMNTLATRRSIMTLYSGTDCVLSHACRIVLQEKDIECEVVYTDPTDTCQELAEFNPYYETPTLVDRDLILYDPFIINEYLDERLPHPPLMPVDPVSRAKQRLMIMRLKRDWFDSVRALQEDKRDNAAHKVIRDGLISISPLFTEQDYAMGDEYSLVDVILAPILWRLPVMNIVLPKQAQVVEEYAERLFARDAFQAGLSDTERDLRGF